MWNTRRFVAVAACVACLVAWAGANQEEDPPSAPASAAWRRVFGPEDSSLDRAVVLDDVDGGGARDVALLFRKEVRFFSGASGRLIRTPGSAGFPAYDGSIQVRSAGDVDSDGTPELATWGHESPFRIASVAKGTILLEQDRPVRQLARAGDLDGDGCGELLVAYPPLSGDGQVFDPSAEVALLSGRTLEPLQRFVEEDDFWGRWGDDLGTFTDLDGDGLRELAIGDWDHERGGAGQNFGRVEVRSSATGALLWHVFGDEEVRAVSQPVDLGDLDGDGEPELGVSGRVRGRAGLFVLRHPSRVLVRGLHAGRHAASPRCRSPAPPRCPAHGAGSGLR